MGRRFTKSERKRLHTQDKLSSVPTQSEVQSPFRVVQAQTETQQIDYPDLQTQLKTANQFGHKLADISTQASGSTPSLSLIQPKLTIGAPGDKYEQEADQVAQQVVQQLSAPPAKQSSSNQALQRENMPEDEELQMKPGPQLQRQESVEAEDEELQMKPESQLQRQESAEAEEEELQMKPEPQLQRQESAEAEEEELQMKSSVQRQENVDEDESSPDLETSIEQARGSGQTLDKVLQHKMGQVMGADFSGVKVHTDTQSDQLNQSIQARAFTTKQDIFFRKGAYDPSSPGGQELIAHELTHVMQQNGSDVSLQRIISAPCGVVQRDYYAWGNAGETPHLHVYNDGFHLKISDRGGIQRYNIVKKNQIHAQSADALAAVEGKHFRKLRRRIKRVAKDEFGFDL